MKRFFKLIIPVLLLSCSTGQQTTKTHFSVIAGINKGGITENTDMPAVGKEPDAFTGATKSGYHAGIRASQRFGNVDIESGFDFMNNRQTLRYNDAGSGFAGTRDMCVNQVNVPLILGIYLFPGKLPKTGLRLSAGYLTQFNHLFTEDNGSLPDYTLNKRSSGATLSLQGNLLTENGKPRLGLYGTVYRGSRIFTDPYNPAEAETPGSSFAAIGLKFYLFSR